jgi:hypothetical protein
MMESELRQVVQSLLRPADTCVHAVQGRLLGLADLAERLCAIVKHEAREEYALFIFSLDELESPSCCVLQGIFPIRGHFSAHTQAIRGGWSEVLVATGDGSTLLINIPGDQFPQVFISQLNSAAHLFSNSGRRELPTAFDWLAGYEGCRTGWDRFSKPRPQHSTNPFAPPTTSGSGSLETAFPENWPWSHIITPNSDGSTDVANCEQDLSEFDPLHVSNNGSVPVPMETFTIREPSPTPSPNNNPFAPDSTNPFSTSPSPPPPSSTSYLVPTSAASVGMRSCTSESNLRRLQTEVSQQSSGLRGDPLISRSSDNLVSINETERHCVAGGLGQCLGDQTRLGVLTSSTSSLSSGGWENGENGEEGREEEFSASVQITDSRTKKKGWGLRGREGRRTTASAGQRYSKFEVISPAEITGRHRLNQSPDLRDLRKPREAVRLRFKKATGSETKASKANMDQPELSSHLPLPSLRQRPRAETRARSSTHWVSRYRPGVPVPRANVRESIVQAELRQKEKEFCNQKTLR